MPSFFKKFPVLSYTLDGYNKDAMNIVTAAVLKRINVDKSYVYQSYDVPNGATAESLAYDLYKDPTLCWVFFLVNGMVNPLLDWPMDDSVLEEFVVAKYGSLYSVVYFTDLDGYRLDDVAEAAVRAYVDAGNPMPANVHPVTALEAESELNRKRGKIVIVAPRYINQFVDLFNKSIEGKV
ncbi:tail tube associated baseplate protein [Xanthomonas phage X1]|nr:tail tube associated baseplate protein [Xanthomonas phage X1]